jgi:methylenetetrahydrofolate--tRNA-(uracil-5-)-methyltransferase
MSRLRRDRGGGKALRSIYGYRANGQRARQLAEAWFGVALVEMKPFALSPAHQSPLCGELVCSNSLRSDDPVAPAGLLKHELRRCGSLVIACADQHRVPAGQALAVERFGFARAITAAGAIRAPDRAAAARAPRGAGDRVHGALDRGPLGEVIRAEPAAIA